MKNPSPDRVRVPESRCLNCGKLMDALGTGDYDVPADPHPGDVTICIKCGAVMRLDGNLRMRGMTDAEMDELVADKEWMNQVAKMVGAIHFMKHMEG
jgi:hypothetical protein